MTFEQAFARAMIKRVSGTTCKYEPVFAELDDDELFDFMHSLFEEAKG